MMTLLILSVIPSLIVFLEKEAFEIFSSLV